MMVNPKISVIVPIYMAEDYLYRCVDSILAQSFIDFELLLIDDGSPDVSGIICDDYAARDRRVRVFHKENGGVSSARQMGMDYAIGEYLIHVDPDDWVEPSMLEELYTKAKEENVDMVICDFYEEHRKRTIYAKQCPKSLESEVVLRQMLLQQLHGSCCNKLIRRDCYIRYKITFPVDVTCWEDLYVTCELLRNGCSITYLNKAFYHYDCFTQDNSLVHKVSLKKLHSFINVITHFESVLDPLSFQKELYYLKKCTKTVAFIDNHISETDYRLLFSEINDQIQKEYFTNQFPVSTLWFASWGLKYNYRLAYYMCVAIRSIKTCLRSVIY